MCQVPPSAPRARHTRLSAREGVEAGVEELDAVGELGAGREPVGRGRQHGASRIDAGRPVAGRGEAHCHLAVPAADVHNPSGCGREFGKKSALHQVVSQAASRAVGVGGVGGAHRVERGHRPHPSSV